MPLSHENQIFLLKDILQNHQSDCCGSVSECEQVERLVKSLMVNTDVNENVRVILEEIYRYSQDGINSSDLDAHINSHQTDLNHWVDDIGRFY
ncbi:YtzH-like family protein [Peribacillus glennii]|uniref:YtzH-like protein n=1 Tax=Peribacillus glennii TaxID=2303991 RepID=A0A372LJT6_9BACI|nr:YtzH-like family protein [Peribacillus glennii]RFU66264.1 hypothetical protein D0466_01420 [Peribacillus glennii]